MSESCECAEKDAQPVRPRTGESPVASSRRRMRAFTLIELLVVIGIMIVLMGGLGLAIAGRGGEGAALANAQSILASVVGAARAQAALHQTSARVIVYAQMPTSGDANKYLRALQVVRQEIAPNGSAMWVAVGDYVTLPAPVCVVPPAPVPTNHLKLPTGQTWNNNLGTGPVSTFTMVTSFNYLGQSIASGGRPAVQFFGAQNQSGRIFYLEFASDGTVVAPIGIPPNTPTKIAVATAILGGNALPLFNNSSGVRGLFVRKSGAVALVNDATSF